MPRQKEKTKRNREIFCLKEGLDEPEQYHDVIKEDNPIPRPNEQLSYADLGRKFELSATWLQKLIKRWRKRYE